MVDRSSTPAETAFRDRLEELRDEIEHLNERCFAAGSDGFVKVRTAYLSDLIDTIRDELRAPGHGLAEELAQ